MYTYVCVYIGYGARKRNNLKSGEKYNELFLYPPLHCLKHDDNYVLCCDFFLKVGKA